MPRSLTWKLTLAFLAVGLTAAGLVAVFVRLANPGQLERLVVEQQRGEFNDRLTAYYEVNGSWAGVSENLFEDQGPPWQQGGDPGHGFGGGPGGGGPPDFRRERRELFGLADPSGTIIIPLFPDYEPGDRVPDSVLAQGEPVTVDGEVVGTILTAERVPGLSPAEMAYLGRVSVALVLASGGAIVVALVVGWLLARTLTRPVRALTQAAHRMAGGELEQQVAVTSGDEIGELAGAFNRMSQAVARANRARRQMTADIAHELRTPLTVIAGYIESMRDGVLAPTPQRLTVIASEIDQLQHLVGELRLLTQADAGELKLNLQPVAPVELLGQARAAFEHQAAKKGVSLEMQANGPVPEAPMDEARMAQVLSNLISNALRYTPEGGRVALGAGRADGRVTLTVQDTGPGIALEDLPFVFDRFYRADGSRSEADGESGLGLSIAKAIVEAHGGTLEAASAPGAGATFTIKLPVSSQ